MTRASLLHVLDHSTALGPHEVRELEQLAQAFPYCQTAHLLLAKAAHDQGAMLAGQRLRRAATYAADRALLRRLIEAVPVPNLVPEATEAPVAEAAIPELLAPQPARFVVQRLALAAVGAAADAVASAGGEGTAAGANTAVAAAPPEEERNTAPLAVAGLPDDPAKAATTAETVAETVAETTVAEAAVVKIPVAEAGMGNSNPTSPQAPNLAPPSPDAASTGLQTGRTAAPGWSVSSSATAVVPAVMPTTPAKRPAVPVPIDAPTSNNALSADTEAAGAESVAAGVSADFAPVAASAHGNETTETASEAAPEAPTGKPAAAVEQTTPTEPVLVPAADGPAPDNSHQPTPTEPAPPVESASLVEVKIEMPVAETAAETALPAAPTAETPPLAPPVRPPAGAGAARFEYGLADTLDPTPAYLLPGLSDEWTWTLPPKPYVPPALTPAAFLGDEAVGYGWGEGSRLGLALSGLNLDGEEVAANSATFALPLPGDFFAPDALVQQHWATHRPTAPPPPTSLELIETFLRQKPRLSRPAFAKTTSETPADLAAPSTQAPPELVSESLARILARQGKLARAVEVYERLMVKHPEKLAYFAAEIQSLQLQQPPLP